MKAAIYCRVSTSMQEEANSLENQIDRCKMFCNMRQFEVVKVYTDVETGINDERFEFLELKKAASRKEFDVVIVTELQRLSRKLTTLLSFVIELEEYQVGFVSISQNFDTTSAIGRAMLKLIGVFAEFEREQISERVSNTLKSISAQGKWSKGAVPHGYRLVNGDLEIYESEAKDIREMFDMFLKGISRLKIAAHFGIHPNVIDKRLRNEIYIGNIVVGKTKKNVVTGKTVRINKIQVFKGQHKPIIDEVTFQTVKNIMENMYNKRDNSREYLLSGLLVCFCGRQMYGTTKAADSKYQYYNCRPRSGSVQTCKKKHINMKEFDNEILNILSELEKHPSSINKFYNTNTITEKTTKKVDIEKLKKFKSELEKKKEDLVDMLLDGLITKEQYKTREIKFVAEIQKYEKDIEQFGEDQKQITERSFKEQHIKEYLKKLHSEDFLERKTALKLIISRIVFINDFEYRIEFDI